MSILTADGRMLTIRLTLPITGTSDWPEILLPKRLTESQWNELVALLEVMKPGLVEREGGQVADGPQTSDTGDTR